MSVDRWLLTFDSILPASNLFDLFVPATFAPRLTLGVNSQNSTVNIQNQKCRFSNLVARASKMQLA